MVRGSLLFSVVHWWLVTLHLVILNPLLIFKVAFLWLSMAFAVSYIFFLLAHKADVVHVRQELVFALVRSCLLGFVLSTVLVALYESIVQNMLHSNFFQVQHPLLASWSLLHNDPDFLYKRLCGIMTVTSGLIAAHYVGLMLERWYEYQVSERYGWFIMASTLVCLGFLWSVSYVM